MQTWNTVTDWQTTHEAHGSSRRRWCFFFSLTDVTLALPGQQLKVVHTTDTCLIHLKTNTKFLRLHLWYIFLNLEPQRPRLQNCPDYIFSLHQTSVFYLQLSYSVLPPCQSLSLFEKNSLQEPRNFIVTMKLRGSTPRTGQTQRGLYWF